jgi:hypothetical protein
VPLTLRRTAPSSVTPARSRARRSFSSWRSTIRSSTARINRSCGIASKRLAMSVSTTQRRPRKHSSRMSRRASRAVRPGRKPKEHGSKSASKIGSITAFAAVCTIRSHTLGIESARRSREPGLGMKTRRVGSGRCC